MVWLYPPKVFWSLSFRAMILARLGRLAFFKFGQCGSGGSLIVSSRPRRRPIGRICGAFPIAKCPHRTLRVCWNPAAVVAWTPVRRISHDRTRRAIHRTPRWLQIADLDGEIPCASGHRAGGLARDNPHVHRVESEIRDHAIDFWRAFNCSREPKRAGLAGEKVGSA